MDRQIVQRMRGVIAPHMWRAAQGMVYAFARNYARDIANGLYVEAHNMQQEFARAMTQYARDGIRDVGQAVGNAITGYTEAAIDAGGAIVEYGGNALESASASLSELLAQDREIVNYDQREAGRQGRDNDERQVARRREPTSSQSATPSTRPTMEPEAIDNDVEMARAPGLNGNNPSKETPISNPPTITYGLQETHTTKLAYRGYMSVMGMDYSTPNQVKIRMNTLWNFIDNTLQSNTPAANEYRLGNKKVDCLGGDNLNLMRGSGKFPSEMSTSDITAERPQWRDYWMALYEYYTVLECNWKVHVQNVSSAGYIPIECAVQYDSYSDTASQLGNVMPKTNYTETRAFKNIKWYTIEQQFEGVSNTKGGNPEKEYKEYPLGSRGTTISGTYRPGMIKRNIRNDGDVRTWTPTISSPDLNEILTLNFFPHELAFYQDTRAIAANLVIELYWTVQFKDLKAQGRYPNSLNNTGQIQQHILHQSLANQTNSDSVRMIP